MKKFLALILVAVLCTGMLLLTGCGADEVDMSADATAGNYCLTRCSSNEEYVQFLNNFDYDKNEILYVTTGEGNNYLFFYVTWRVKESTNTSDKEINSQAKATISVKEILQNNENYIVIATDNTVTMVPKTMAEFVVSSESNLLILEKTDTTITKVTFCITQEILESIK